MLLSYEVTSATDAKNYFASSLSPGGESNRHGYFSEGQESPGVYGGKLGLELGLAGKTVDQETFFRLCDNLHPLTGRKLTPRTNKYRRVCYDFTVSGPKSFSIIEAFATEAERQCLRQAFNEAVVETVAEDMEPDMMCRERRGGADHDIAAGNVLTAGFDHATARPLSKKDLAAWLAANDNLLPGWSADDNIPPDPHWHKHLLVWNATRRADGKILAGQFGELVHEKPYYRAAFYARLAKKLEGMGYVIDRRGDVDWEIAGITQSMIDKFSKRTSQIEAEAEKRGITDEGRKAALGAEIRAKKQKELTLPELRKAWWSQLTDDERDALARVYARQIEPAQEVTAAEAVEFALAHCSEKLSIIPERELKRVALLFGLGSVTPEQIGREMLSPQHGLISGVIDGRRVVTTEALQDQENSIADYAADGRGAVAPIGVAEGLTRQLADGKTLNDEQFQAVTDLLASPNRWNVLLGPAGAGKSSLLAKFDEGAKLAGQHITYLGTTAAAVGVLEEDRLAANTVARFLVDDKMQAAARGGRVVIDEPSMLGHKELLRLMEAGKKHNLKYIFCGDEMQHGSVGRGATLRLLTEKGMIQPFRLTKIMRQKDPQYRAAAQLLSEGKSAEGFDAIDRLGWVAEMPEAKERQAAMAEDYVQARQAGLKWNDVLVISPTHAEAGRITQAIRRQLRECGQLAGEEREFTRLAAVDASEAERGQATTYRSGNLVIQFHQNAKGGFERGERLAVADPAQVPLGEAGKFTVYRPEKIGLAVGDVIRFTGTVKAMGGGKHVLKNGAAHAVAGFTDAGNIRLDNGWVVAKDAGHFRHGFVETSIGSQGRTVRQVLLGMPAEAGKAINMQQLYVSASRAKDGMRLYTDDKEAVRYAAQRDSRQLLALDLKPAAKQAEAGLLNHLERERRLALLHRPFRYLAGLVAGRRPPTPPAPTATHAARERARQQERSHGYGR